VKRWDQLNLEVEPCGDARWARIERELFAKLDAMPAAELAAPIPALVEDLLARPVPHYGPWIAAAASMAAVAAALSVVAFVRPGAWTRGTDPVTLTTTDTPLQFLVGESSLVMTPSSLITLKGDDDHGVDVALDRGTVTFEVAPRRGRPSFRVDAGDVHVRVIGTLFTVARDTGSTRVSVTHGTVEVTSKGAVTILHDGDRWPSRTGTDAIASAGATSDGPAPASLAAASSKPRRGKGGPSGAPWDEPPTDDSADPPLAMPDAVETPAPTEIRDPAQDAYENATRTERANPDEAAAVYRELSSGNTQWAPNSLFALGRLEGERGHRTEAIRLLRLYLARYPHGVNATDARVLLRRLAPS
jgi:FecR protein